MVELIAGSQLGPYRILRLLGRGGMGVVYLAEHVHTEWKRAIKVLAEDLLENSDFTKRFMREAAILDSLEHPNIVKIREVGEEEGICFLVMEYVEGPAKRPKTLADRLVESGGRLPPDECARLMIQVCEAVAYAHEKDILHRDLKPSNILLDEEGNAIVSDFGLAQVVGHDFFQSRIDESIHRSLTLGAEDTFIASRGAPGEQSLGDERTGRHAGTSSRSMLGTWDFMSPEVKKGKEATVRSDIYTLGIILYRCLVGRQTAFIELPTQLVEGLTAKWDEVCRKAGSLEPEKRYSSCQELVRDLRLCLESTTKPTGRSPTSARKSHHDEEFLRAQHKARLQAEFETAVQAGHPHEIVRIGMLLRNNGWLSPDSRRIASESHKSLVESQRREEWTRKELTRLREKGLEAQLDQRFEEALDIWNRAIELDPEDSDLRISAERSRKILGLRETIPVAYKNRKFRAVLNLTNELEGLGVRIGPYSEFVESSKRVLLRRRVRIIGAFLVVALVGVPCLGMLIWDMRANPRAYPSWLDGIVGSGEDPTPTPSPSSPVDLFEPTPGLVVPAVSHTPKTTNTPTHTPSPYHTRTPRPPKPTRTPIPTVSLQDVAGIVTNSLGMKLKKIPAGVFMRGSDQGLDNEKPRREVTISKPFYIGIHEVTQREYEDLMKTNPSVIGGASHPVIRVSWNDAVRFCSNLSKREKARYRLPTEAEWEYACRASTGADYYWGESFDDAYAWVKGNTKRRPMEVGLTKPNAFGLYDMLGNAGEWCLDYYSELYYLRASVDPFNKGDSRSKTRVMRGGHYNLSSMYCRTSARFHDLPDTRREYAGFRVVLEASSIERGEQSVVGGSK